MNALGGDSMDTEKLVDFIVEEVYKRIKETPTTLREKKLAVVFNDREFHKYYEILGNQYEVLTYDESIKDCDVAIVPKLCLKSIANIASLTPSSEEESFIITMIMKGRKVYVMEEGLQYRKYKDTAPKQVYIKYLDFEKQLRNYGVEIIGNSFGNSEITNNGCTPGVIKKKLITEEEVRGYYNRGVNTIVIDSKSIVTPLAVDFLKIHHIDLVKRSGG